MVCTYTGLCRCTFARVSNSCDLTAIFLEVKKNSVLEFIRQHAILFFFFLKKESSWTSSSTVKTAKVISVQQGTDLTGK